MTLKLTTPTTDADTLFKLAAGSGPIAVKARREIARRTFSGLKTAVETERRLRLVRAS